MPWLEALRIRNHNSLAFGSSRSTFRIKPSHSLNSGELRPRRINITRAFNMAGRSLFDVAMNPLSPVIVLFSENATSWKTSWKRLRRFDIVVGTAKLEGSQQRLYPCGKFGFSRYWIYMSTPNHRGKFVQRGIRRHRHHSRRMV
jgi:hypothetical protein